jgi:RalA-binding protein 1
MDDSSTDEQEFPGLYTEKGKRNEENESNSSENFDSKKSLKKDKKDKKDKSDRQYEALGAESDEDAESKLFRSPSKSKKSKTFKFPSAAKKRTEKSKEREPDVKDTPDGKDKKEKKEKKDKEHKEKDKKEKKKEKSKGISNDASEPAETFRVFGMSLGLAVERSKCHDGIKLPLVVRNCIDYLQDNLNSEQIYKVEGLKNRIQNLKKCYNNREPLTEEMDVATASTLLRTYISELPEPILTTELTARFEEVSALPEVTTQAKEFSMLIDQLPKVNQVLLAWISRHLSAVINHGKSNKINAQSLAVLLSPILQMSHRLLITLLCHADLLFADVHLEK